MSLTKVSYSMITGAPVNVLDLGVDSTGGTDCTSLIQAAIAASTTIVFPTGSYLFSGNVNNLLVNVSNIEFVLEAGAELIKTGTGALFYVGSTAGTYQNIRFTGAGVIKNPITKYTQQTTAIQVGSTGATIDSLMIDGLTIRMSKYGIVSGALDAVITNAVITNNRVFVDVDGWATGAQVAQPMDFNLPSAPSKPGGIVANNIFELTNNVSTKGDAFKWTNFNGVFDGNHCRVYGQGQTVAVLNSCENFAITSSVFETSGSVEDALQINTISSGRGVVDGITALAGPSAGGSIQIGNLTGVSITNIKANQAIRQTASTTISNSDIQNFTAKELDMSATGTAFNQGSIVNGRLSGQAYITANDSSIRDIFSDMNATAIRGLYIKGYRNNVSEISIRNSTTYAIDVAGDDNTIDNVTLSFCSASWQVVSGSNNKFGSFTFVNPVGTNYLNNGTNTGYPNLVFTGLTGTTTLAVPSNPTGFTKVRLVGGAGNTTITNLTGAADGDRVALVVTDSTYNYTFTRANAALSGGTNWVGDRYDSLSLIYDTTNNYWIELARSANS